MRVQLLIYNPRKSQVWDVASLTESVSWETNRTGSPGTLKFTVMKAGDLDFLEGDNVTLTVDGQRQFYGWVFTKSKNRWGEIEVTCYDRLRYLKASASYAFYNLTAEQILQQIAADLQLDVSTLESTGYVIPSLIEENQSCLDIVSAALEQVLLNTGNLFVLLDDGDGLSIRSPQSMVSGVLIGEKSCLTDYTYQTDIDAQTYNSVKLSVPNEATGRSDVYVAQDSYNIGRWGLLQLYQQVDGDFNEAQLKARAEATLNYYNRRMRTLKVSSLGVPGLHAGQLVLMKVPDLGDIALDQYVLLDRVSHTWENGVHTMEFETLDLTEV